jgi:biopolymer transport protein TolR
MSRLRKRRVMNQINVVPYIDVTLVLLVIFMVTSPMTNPGTVELPKVGSDILKPQATPSVIIIEANGRVKFEEKTYANDELLYRIRKEVKQNPDKSFVISADKSVSYEKVVAVLELLKKAGAKVGLLLNPS